ncbi:D-serine deaminase, pyridoxal phosphate-dependent [Spirosomataceae bacterium TFI 002]|nr:D-serine deaminase, pyridoxal phosphate-dependent [Spirosomataceae bacterium TFI 002]
MNWYEIKNIETVDSPSLLIFKDRLIQNIDQMIAMVDGDTNRLMPHVKTNKCIEVVGLMVAKGIKKFKASTIAEAEMAAMAGANKVLIAHQLVGPKIDRFNQLCKTFPKVDFSFLLDNASHLSNLNTKFIAAKVQVNVYIDINNGMNRSGIKTENLNDLINKINACETVNLLGLHVYDGHHRQVNFEERLEKIESDFSNIDTTNYEVISGGSPAFNIHSKNKNRICSPGTSVFWDWGYGEKFKEQGFKEAAILVTRVISKPSEGLITIDLGHKAVAAENPIDRRIKFLNLNNYVLLSQSEEHGVLSVENWNEIAIGDVFYGVPYHVCPSVNLYEEMGIVVDNEVQEYWQVIARKRKITI